MGDTDHVALGTDLDGGFGREQSPSDVETIADLQRFTKLLSVRGFAANDTNKILSKNWLRKFRDILPSEE